MTSSPLARGFVAESAQPLVIAHRGTPGYRPELTLAGFELAARMGADGLEFDLVSTADGVLVVRHEPQIGATTDIAAHPEFADRYTTRTIDGVVHEGWFTDDLTLAELRTLRAVERIPQIRPDNTIYDGRYPVATFDEVLALRERLSAELGRPIAIYPEIKHSSYFASVGLPLEPALVDALDRAGLNRRDSPVFVQSFETANLRALRSALRVGLVQLLDGAGAPADLVAAGDPRDHAALTAPDELASIAGYADAIGPAKSLVLGADGGHGPLVADAHAAGLRVFVFTFRNENLFLPASLRSAGPDSAYGDAFAEYELAFRAGVDGVFSDNPDTALAARVALLAPVA